MFYRNIFKDIKTLELTTDGEETLELWKAAFLRSGVYPEKNEDEDDGQVYVLYSLASADLQISSTIWKD